MNLEKEIEVLEYIKSLKDQGLVTENRDGTFTLSPEVHAKAQKMVNEHPELFKEIFPDRVN